MILGKKVKFRAMEEKDLGAVVGWMNDPEISHFVVGWAPPISLAQQKEWFFNSMNDTKNQRWIVETLDGAVIGLTGLWDIDWHNRNALTALKIGAPMTRGKGYGTDAIMTLMTYAFCEFGLRRLWGDILTYNVASYKAYVKKCGWKVEGIKRQHVFRSGQYFDVISVGILKEEFLAHPMAAAYIPQDEVNKISLDSKELAPFNY